MEKSVNIHDFLLDFQIEQTVLIFFLIVSAQLPVHLGVLIDHLLEVL